MERYVHEAKNITKEWKIETAAGPTVNPGRRVWPKLTEEKMRESFNGCQLRIAKNQLVLMTDNNDNTPVFEELLKEGTLTLKLNTAFKAFMYVHLDFKKMFQ